MAYVQPYQGGAMEPGIVNGYHEAPFEEPLRIEIVVPEGALPGHKLTCKTPDNQELRLTVPEGVPPGSIMNLTQDPVTKAWKCMAEPADSPEEYEQPPVYEAPDTMPIVRRYEAPQSYAPPPVGIPQGIYSGTNPGGTAATYYDGRPPPLVTTYATVPQQHQQQPYQQPISIPSRSLVGHQMPVNLSYVPQPVVQSSVTMPPGQVILAGGHPPLATVVDAGQRQFFGHPGGEGYALEQRPSYVPPVVMHSQQPSYTPPPVAMMGEAQRSYTPLPIPQAQVMAMQGIQSGPSYIPPAATTIPGMQTSAMPMPTSVQMPVRPSIVAHAAQLAQTAPLLGPQQLPPSIGNINSPQPQQLWNPPPPQQQQQQVVMSGIPQRIAMGPMGPQPGQLPLQMLAQPYAQLMAPHAGMLHGQQPWHHTQEQLGTTMSAGVLQQVNAFGPFGGPLGAPSMQEMHHQQQPQFFGGQGCLQGQPQMFGRPGPSGSGWALAGHVPTYSPMPTSQGPMMAAQDPNRQQQFAPEGSAFSHLTLGPMGTEALEMMAPHGVMQQQIQRQ